MLDVPSSEAAAKSERYALPSGRAAVEAPDSALSLLAEDASDWRRVFSPPNLRAVAGWRSPERGLFGASLFQLLKEEKSYGHGFLFAPVAVGCGAAIWLSLPNDPWPWLWAIAFIFCLGCRFLSRRGLHQFLAVTASLVLAGMLLAELELWRRSTVILDAPVTTDITGVIERSEMTGTGRMRYLVRLTATANPQLRRSPQIVSLVARDTQDTLQIGSGISGRARLSPPPGPALPSLHDFSFSAYFDGIGAVGYFYRAPTAISPMQSDRRTWAELMERKLFELRAQIGNRIRSTVPGDAGAFAAAIVTDERRAISDETVEALRISGLAHIVAISGLNMALAAGIFFVGLRSLLALSPVLAQTLPTKKIAATGALAMVTCYYLISGFGVSAQRAYIMMAIMLVAVVLDRPSISLRNVALSALIILSVNPSEVLGPSFQMSFAATAALVAGYAIWSSRQDGAESGSHPVRHPLATSAFRLWHFIAGITLTSVIGSMATAMFAIEHFHRIAMHGLAANLAAMPIISFLVMPSGLAAMLLMPFGLDKPFLYMMATGLGWVIDIAAYVSSWRGDLPTGQMHPWFLPFGVGGFILLTLLRTRLRLCGVPMIVTAAVLFVVGPPIPPSSLLISEDGSLVGAASTGSLAINRTKPPDFLFAQWARARRLAEPVKSILLPDDPMSPSASRDPKEKLSPEMIRQSSLEMTVVGENAFTCRKRAWCAIRLHGDILIVAVEDGRYTGAACDVADLVISPRVRFDTCRSGTPLLSGRTLRKTGAVEIETAGSRSPENWSISTSVADVSRPWTKHRSYDWKRDVFDPTMPAWLSAGGKTVDSEVSSNSGEDIGHQDFRRNNAPSPVSDIYE